MSDPQGEAFLKASEACKLSFLSILIHVNVCKERSLYDITICWLSMPWRNGTAFFTLLVAQWLIKPVDNNRLQLVMKKSKNFTWSQEARWLRTVFYNLRFRVPCRHISHSKKEKHAWSQVKLSKSPSLHETISTIQITFDQREFVSRLLSQKYRCTQVYKTLCSELACLTDETKLRGLVSSVTQATQSAIRH